MLTREVYMVEAAERETRPESVPSAGFYTWAIPGKPVEVALPLALIDQIDGEAVQNFRSLSSRGSEIGGLLFGTVAAGNPTIVTVTSYAAIVCDYALGPLFRLSESDLSRLDAAIAKSRDAGAIPVGFFRSHTRKGLSLDPADSKLLDSRFAQPHCVALLVRPSVTKASTAAIFIRENGTLRGAASYLEFPFRSSELMSSESAISTPAGRARIVPIASRREPINNPFGPVDAPGQLSNQSGALASPLAPAVAMPQLKDLEAGSIAAAASKSRGRFYTCLSAIAILGIAVLFLANSGGLGWHRAVPAASPSITAGLSLQAERRPGELLLTWDSQSEAIRNASRAVLEISDGAHRENIVMDQTQLRNGSFAYSPSTGDVVFKMDVTAGQSKVIESVRVLTAAPLPAAGKTQRDALQKKPGTPTANSSENAAAKEPPPADSEPSPKPQLISRIEPEYPDAARDAGAKGPVKVSATIGMDGKVKSVRPMSGDAVLFQPATEAVMQWLYHPAMRNGVPVEAETQIVLNFAAER